MATDAAEEEYYREDKAVFRAFKEAGFTPRVIFDIGSSHSGWSYTIAQIFPEAQFHLFEPQVEMRPFYKTNTERILKLRPDFTVHKIALGSRNGKTQMIANREGFGATTIVRRRFGHFVERFQVPMYRLETFRSVARLPNPELIKIDVQGGELDVLKGAGALLYGVGLIQLEGWMKRAYRGKTPFLQEVITFLRRKRFKLVELGERFYANDHELCAVDAFFAQTDLLEKIGAKLPSGPLTSALGPDLIGD
jgi:FkbM family methyltransferase